MMASVMIPSVNLSVDQWSPVIDCMLGPFDVGRILRTFKIKKNVEVTDNGKIII